MTWRSWSTSSHLNDPTGFWADVVLAGVMAVDLKLLPQPNFRGRLASRSEAGGRFVSFKSGPHQLKRTAQQTRLASDEHYLVALQCEGTCNIGQGGDSVTLVPGDIAIMHSGYAFEILFPTQVERRLVLIPRNLLDTRLVSSPPQRGRPLRVSGGTAGGALARDAILHLTAETTSWQANQCALGMDTLAFVLSAEINCKNTAAPVAPTRDISQVTLESIESAIRLRVTDANLSPRLIANCLGISVRTLHRLFARHRSTFSSYILNERLSLGKALLSRPEVRESITDIAMSLGFSDAAHFSRTYKGKFGETPRQTRACAATSLLKSI